MADDAYDEVRTVEYNLAVEHELNQTPGKLSPLVGDSKGYTDKGAQLIDRFGHIDLEEKTTRNGDTNNTDVDVTRRFIKKPKYANVAPLIDRDDMKQTKVDLKSPIAVSTGLGTRRYHDKQWVRGYYGNGWTGEDGDVAVPFDSNNIIDLGGGFTKAALLKLREDMNLGDVDTEAEEPIVLLDPQSETGLFNIQEYIDADFNESRPMVRGEVKPWLGFRFVRANLKSRKAFGNAVDLMIPAANHIALPAFVPSGLHRGAWTEFWGKIEELPNKQYSTQIYAEACSAVVRTDEAKCYQLVIDHS